ncbi:MAG: peptidase domain protein [Phycisphaerales bacterium]|nr:peptidase domain protein [Phycisphaerales bacterium]
MLLSGSPAAHNSSGAAEAEGLPGIHVPASGAAGDSSGTAASGGALHALSELPLLHSDAGAPAEIYLDFTGAPAQAWGSYHVTQTPAYSIDGDTSTFSDTELANIRQIWASVAEKYSPFNLDVTTQDPGQYTPGHVQRVVIGGDGLWQGNNGWGGISFVGEFLNGPTTSWIFPNNLANGDPHDVGEAAAHEAGHDFGLQHQAVYSGKKLTDQYNRGTAESAPIMGASYFAQRGTWWDGQSVLGYNVNQDDMATIASKANGFGYRPLSHGQSLASADAMTLQGSEVTASGIIESTTQTDFLSFTTGAGTVNLTGIVAPYGAMLHMKMSLLDAAGNVVASADAATLGQSISAALPAGTYYVEVASHGGYGDVGEYGVVGTIVPSASSGTVASVPPAAPAPAPSSPPASGGTTSPAAPAPVASESLKASVIRNKVVQLIWDRLPKKVVAFVQRSVDGVTWTRLGKFNYHTTRFTDRKAHAGTYTYRIMTVAPGGVTAYSNPVSATLTTPVKAKHAAGLFSEEPITLATARLRELVG